jgi:MFS family permease
MPDFHNEHHAAAHPKFSYMQIVAMPVILFAFGYLLFTSMASGAIQNFSTASFIDFYHAPLAAAASALAAYLVCAAIGMLVGGVIADHTVHHARVAAAGLVAAAVFAGILATGWLPFALVTLVLAMAGLCQGITVPLRDILVKSAAPPGSIGRVFGIVYSGGDAALAIAPLVFGALVDRHAYHAIFGGVAILYLIGVVTVSTIGQKRAMLAG